MEQLIIYQSHRCHKNKIEVDHDLVELPDGGQAEIKSIRPMKLSSDLILDGVLYVPKFRIILLLVSKLTQALKCNVTFYPEFCVVEDVLTKKMIGLAKQLMDCTTTN